MSSRLLSFFIVLLLCVEGRSQQTVAVPFQFEVAAGQLALYSLEGRFDFGTVAPGDQRSALQVPNLMLEDTTSSETGYHMTISASPFRSESGHSLPADLLTCAGPAVVISPVDVLGPAPRSLVFSGSGLQSAVRIVECDQLLFPTAGKGVWKVHFDASKFLLTLPASSPAGSYTSVITISLAGGI
jgi:hypothetical protein